MHVKINLNCIQFKSENMWVCSSMMCIFHGRKEENGQITGVISSFLEHKRILIVKKYITGDRILVLGCGYRKLASLLNLKNKYYIYINMIIDIAGFTRSMLKIKINIKFYYLDEFERLKLDYLR